MAQARPDGGSSSNSGLENDIYNVEPNRWYKAYPYGFAFSGAKTKQGDAVEEIFLLPIAPNNINTTTHFATNIVTTLYGIIEEHSEVRYYDITISGNTGIAPKNVLPTTSTLSVKKDPFNQPPPNEVDKTKPSVGRISFKPQSGLVGSLGGFLPEVTNTINAAANLVKSVTTNADSINETGITPTQSGYYAFHNFYKFLLRYKQDVSGTNSNSGSSGFSIELPKIGGGSNGKGSKIREVHPLQFLNYKDNIKYDVVPIAFTLTRSADNPLLYVYNIKLRAFNLRNATSKVDSNNLLADLGLGDIKGSLFSKMTGVVGKASTLISGLGGIK
jgi:hypothetical protein